jgi:putative PIN family toxin of toxin-antitoxin system
MLRAVLDTNILVAAVRSRSGASNLLLRALDEGRFEMLVSVPMFLEYEAVLSRPEHRRAAGIGLAQVGDLLDYLAGLIRPVKLHYLWRPQLTDAADEMVLETAINGRADCIVTFNERHFGPSVRFGIETMTPAAALGRL